MTYDILCYKPITDQPSVEEARRILEAGDEFPRLERVPDPNEKWNVAAALVRFDPRLQPVKLDREKLATTGVDPGEKAEFKNIELNNFSTHLSIQLEIFEDSVGVTVPYWFEGPDADQVFTLVSDYLRVIRETMGYFVYDPQAEVAFDPAKTEFRNLHDYAARHIYKDTMKRLPDIMAEIAKDKKNRKPTNES